MKSDWRETVLIVAIAMTVLVLHTLTAVIALAAWIFLTMAVVGPPISAFMGFLGGMAIGAVAMRGYMNIESGFWSRVVYGIVERVYPS